MLDLVEELMPCGSHMWEKVATQLVIKGYDRTQQSCKDKFEKMAFAKKPTGQTEVSFFKFIIERLQKF